MEDLILCIAATTLIYSLVNICKPDKTTEEPITFKYLVNHCFCCKARLKKPVEIYSGEKLYCKKCAKHLTF